MSKRLILGVVIGYLLTIIVPPPGVLFAKVTGKA